MRGRIQKRVEIDEREESGRDWKWCRRSGWKIKSLDHGKMLRKRQIPFFYRKLDEEHLFVLLRFGDVSRQIRILRRFEVRSPPIGDSVQHLAKKGERVSRSCLTIPNWLSGRDKIGSLTAPSSWSGRRYDLTSQWADVWVHGLDLLPASLHHQATWKRCFLKAMKDC